MTTSILARTIYVVAISGLLIAATYVFGLRFNVQNCPAVSHWAVYEGEEITPDNFFGPGTRALAYPARQFLNADIPSLYKLSGGSDQTLIRMISWGHGERYTAGTVLTLRPDGSGQYKARATLLHFVPTHSQKSRWKAKVVDDLRWTLRESTAERLSTHLDSPDAWRACKDFGAMETSHPQMFLIEEASQGKYRMLTQDIWGFRGQAADGSMVILGPQSEWFAVLHAIFNSDLATVRPIWRNYFAEQDEKHRNLNQ